MEDLSKKEQRQRNNYRQLTNTIGVTKADYWREFWKLRPRDKMEEN